MSENITLNDQERAALEALWRAGGEMAIADLQKDLRNAYVDLDVKGLVHMTSKRKGELSAELTDAGRALAVDLFTPPLVFPTSKEAVRAWLTARGLWADTDQPYVSSFSSNGRNYIFVILRPGLAVAPGKQNKYVAAVHVGDVDEDSEAQFRADFDRACKIARALNASVGKGE